MLYNGLKIGVFFKTRVWAERWFEDFLKKIDDRCVLRYVKGGIAPCFIELIDGTRIVAVPILTGARGRWFDRAYVEPGISIYDINTTIRTNLTDQVVVEDEWKKEM